MNVGRETLRSHRVLREIPTDRVTAMSAVWLSTACDRCGWQELAITASDSVAPVGAHTCAQVNPAPDEPTPRRPPPPTHQPTGAGRGSRSRSTGPSRSSTAASAGPRVGCGSWADSSSSSSPTVSWSPSAAECQVGPGLRKPAAHIGNTPLVFRDMLANCVLRAQPTAKPDRVRSDMTIRQNVQCAGISGK